MVDVDVVSAKLAELASRLERIDMCCPKTAAELSADADAMEIVSFNLILAIQVCLDAASHLIADEGWPPVSSLGESFLRLAEHGVLRRDTAQALQPAAGMRNILVHVYASVDPALVHRAATVEREHLERFARDVGAWLREQI